MRMQAGEPPRGAAPAPGPGSPGAAPHPGDAIFPWSRVHKALGCELGSDLTEDVWRLPALLGRPTSLKHCANWAQLFA